ncbi:MAG: TolC family protein [Desulfobacterales bacterium]|nr:TolC family protein [Desulfobacterales bacterium]
MNALKIKVSFSSLIIFLFILNIIEVNAVTLEFKDVLQKAIQYSYDLNISIISTEISKNELNKAKLQFYPELKFRFDSEYFHDFMDGSSSVTAIGNTLYPNNTKYQDSFSVDLSYNILDFGVRKKQFQIAEMDVESSKAAREKLLIDLKTNVLDLYTEALTAYREKNAYLELLPLMNELYVIKNRTYNAGISNKTEIVEQKIKETRIVQNIEEQKNRLISILINISFLTGEVYEEQLVKMLPLTMMEKKINAANFKNHPDTRLYEIEIKKKNLEISRVKKSLLPQVDFYLRYNLYGTDTASYAASYNDIRQRNFSVGLTTTFPILESFEKNYNLKKACFEAEKLKIEKSKKMAEIEKVYLDIKEKYRFYKADIEIDKRILNDIEIKIDMQKRMTKEKVSDYASILEQQAELIKERLEMEKIIITKISAFKKLQFISEVSQ